MINLKNKPYSCVPLLTTHVIKTRVSFTLVLRQWTVYVSEQFTVVWVNAKLFPFTFIWFKKEKTGRLCYIIWK